MRFLTSLTAALVFLLAFSTVSEAKSIAVSTTADQYLQDNTKCSLREAITAAQTDQFVGGCVAGSGADNILLPSGKYNLTRANVGAYDTANETGDLNVSGIGNLSIAPENTSAKVTIDAKGIDRVLNHRGTGSLTLRNLNITGGDPAIGGLNGGGILASANSGPLVLTGVALYGNVTAGAGAGFSASASPSERSIVNSSIFGNRAERGGGGIYSETGVSMKIRSSSIVINLADSDEDGTGDGGGIDFVDLNTGRIDMTNTILASNDDGSGKNGFTLADCATGLGKNFYPRFVLSTQAMKSAGCGTGATNETNISVNNAGFGLPNDAGSQTATVPLLDGSAAIDAAGKADPDLCPAFDQRGTLRPAGKCDIGAYEYPQKFEISVPPAMPKLLAVNPGSTGTTLTPSIRGEAPEGTTVKLFTSSDCESEPVASGSASEFYAGGIPVRVAPLSTTAFYANATNGQGVRSLCSLTSLTYTQIADQTTITTPRPTTTVAVLDGAKLAVLVRCPSRSKSKCVGRAMPVTASGFKKVKRGKRSIRVPRGKAMAPAKPVKIRPGRWVKVTFKLRPAYLNRVRAIAKSQSKRLVVRQQTDSASYFQRYRVKSIE